MTHPRGIFGLFLGVWALLPSILSHFSRSSGTQLRSLRELGWAVWRRSSPPFVVPASTALSLKTFPDSQMPPHFRPPRPFVDPGATRTVIGNRLIDLFRGKGLKPNYENSTIQMVNGSQEIVQLSYSFPTKIENNYYPTNAICVNSLTRDIILGIDLIEPAGLIAYKTHPL